MTSWKLWGTSAALLLLACSTSEPGASESPPDSGTLDAASDAGAGGTDATSDGASPDAASDGSASDAPADAPQKPERRLLFIGNSYTAVNDLPGVLRELGTSAQSPVSFSVTRHTPGGSSWEVHDADPAVDQLIQRGWDTVILQDQSAQPWFAQGVKPALLSLDAKIKQSGAETLLFMTWARVYDPNLYPPHYAMEMAVNQYYERHAAAVGARTAPVGRAWARALRDPAQTLHAADGSHPNARGTYLAACVFYASLTEQSPVGLGGGGLGLGAAAESELQRVAWDTHLARQRLTSPAIGSWPLSAGSLGQDWAPTRELVQGGVVGPGGAFATGTQFGTGRYGAIPYFPGLNAPQLSVVVHAYRADWSVSAMQPEPLVGKSWAYGLWQNQSDLEASLYTTNPTDSTASVRYAINGLSAGWHQFAVTYDGATYALWVDAELVASDDNPGEVRYFGLAPDEIARFNAVAVGANVVDTALNNAPPSPFFTGALAGVQIFDRALAKTELQQL